MGGTDPDEVLRRRLDFGQAPISAHTQVRADIGEVQTGKEIQAGKGSATRPDPVGMRRVSLYVSADAAAALEDAADQIVTALGGGTPRHVALSALLLAGAAQGGLVAQQLVHQRASELAEQLAALQSTRPG